MINTRRHHPRLQARLSEAISTGRPEELGKCLDQLSVSEFRTAGILLSDYLFPELDNCELFMGLWLHIVPTKPKAYLGTFLKAARQLTQKGVLTLNEKEWENYAATCSPIDCLKVLDALLPLADAPAAERLIRLFGATEVETRIHRLIAAGTPACYFCLMQLLRTIDDHPDMLRHTVLLLIRRNDKLAWNMAGLIMHYFDITDLPATFSIRIEPYQLSRAEISFDTFNKILHT